MTSPREPSAHAGMRPRWGALGYPNYRRFWLANLARVYGLQFRFIGGPWLVTELTDSRAMLGVVAATTAISTILVSAPAGVLADRYDNRKLLVWSQALSALADVAIAVLVLTGTVNVWLVVVWAAVAGSLGALGNPALNAILPRPIEMRALPSAVAATSAIWNSARIVGPAKPYP
ncbi:MAG: MFS transporter [Dehalococcoidia bacterium]